MYPSTNLLTVSFSKDDILFQRENTTLGTLVFSTLAAATWSATFYLCALYLSDLFLRRMEACAFLSLMMVCAMPARGLEYKVINQKHAETRRAANEFGLGFDSVFTVCDDATEVCLDGKCCPMPDLGAPGCCPYPDGVCCPHLGRCCRPGYQCASKREIDWLNSAFGMFVAEKFHCVLDYRLLKHAVVPSDTRVYQ